MNAKELKTCAEWYDVDSIHASIQRQLKCGPITRMVESVPAAPPSDIGSREFSEWYARNLRLAMAKGMAFAQREKPKYRPPQPSDDGRWCFLEELPSDAPPTLVRKRARNLVELAFGEKHPRFWEELRDLAAAQLGSPPGLDPMTDQEAKDFEEQQIGFGVHKGTHIKNIPLSYLDWLLRKQEEDFFTMSLIRYMKSLRCEQRIAQEGL